MLNYGPTQLARFKFGLRWEGDTMPKRPGIVAGLQIIAGLMVLLTAYGWAQANDEADLAHTLREAAEVRAMHAERALAKCLNGHAAFPVDGEMAAAWCDKATIQKL